MEVASPLALTAPPGGNKRALSCSPTRMETTGRNGLAEMDVGDDGVRSAKRRRFLCDPSVDSLSEHFSSHSPFSPFFSGSLPGNKSILSTAAAGPQSLKRHRSRSPTEVDNDLKRVVDEQNAVIASLKQDKANLETTVGSLKSDNERIQKENQLLRKAVTIQQDRQKQAEGQLKAAEEYRTGAEDRMQKLEQMILSLRYHLSAQRDGPADDFMGLPPRPPDVF